MHNKALKTRSLASVKGAIAAAKVYAEEHKVPLTAERLAANLDMDLSIFHAIVAGTYREDGADIGAKISAIQTAFSEATASVMEHAMQRGSSPNMHMLYLKTNAGYGEREEPINGGMAPVIFLGEDAIEE